MTIPRTFCVSIAAPTALTGWPFMSLRDNLRPNIWLFGTSEHIDNSRILHSSDQCILIETTINSHAWYFGFVHARSTHVPRRALLSSFYAYADYTLYIMGDFNVVFGAYERSRGAGNPALPSQEFMAFLDEAHLHDMEASGPQFTWVTRHSNHGYMAAHLDRVLVNDEFLDIWHSTSATVLPRISSDHHPILLTLRRTEGQIIRPFSFQHMWMTHSSFLPTVSASWTQYTMTSSPIQLVTRKLKCLKATLKNWNKATFRNICVEMEEASEALNAIQAESALYGDSDDRLMAEINCTVRLNAVQN
ncbi:hypothetical protein ACS0TY_033857 [Phlomoides rotata]